MGLRQGPPLLQCMGQVLRQRVCVGRWCGRALQACAQPGWLLSSTRHKLPRWASKSCRAPGRDHAAFALGHALPSAFNLQLQRALQAEEHLEVIVAVAAGRRPVAPQ